MDLEQLHQLRAAGAEIAELDAMVGEERKYVLVAYELYANGTTSNEPVCTPSIAAQIGERSGLGLPTDPMGFGIWEVR